MLDFCGKSSLRKKFFFHHKPKGQVTDKNLEAPKNYTSPNFFFAKAWALWKIQYTSMINLPYLLQWHPFVSLIKRICISTRLLFKKGILVCFALFLKFTFDSRACDTEILPARYEFYKSQTSGLYYLSKTAKAKHHIGISFVYSSVRLSVCLSHFAMTGPTCIP